VTSLVRRLYRRVLNRELEVVGDELTAVQDTLETLIERYERLRARIGMKELRAERAAGKEGLDPLELRLRAAAGTVANPRRGNGDDWPDAG